MTALVVKENGICKNKLGLVMRWNLLHSYFLQIRSHSLIWAAEIQTLKQAH